jgi:hypothetical protein
MKDLSGSSLLRVQPATHRPAQKLCLAAVELGAMRHPIVPTSDTPTFRGLGEMGKSEDSERHAVVGFGDERLLSVGRHVSDSKPSNTESAPLVGMTKSGPVGGSCGSGKPMAIHRRPTGGSHIRLTA